MRRGKLRRRPSLAGSARIAAALLMLAALAGCERARVGPELPAATEEPPAGVSASEAVSGTDRSLTYVSASPGAFPQAVSITITNLANGASVRVVPSEDGFDPVALPAEPGDALELVVGYANGTTGTFGFVVPRRRPPRVVRTRPPKGATDVVLNATVTVVFSEPVDAGTVTGTTVQLRLDGRAVEGVLSLSADGLRAELVPADQLLPDTSYTVAITRGVHDLDGDPLDEEVRAPFTTVSPPPAPQIAFVSWRDGNAEIYVMNPDGTGQVNLTRSPWEDRDPVWSPDGSKIAFTSDRDGNTEIYVMNADGSDQQNLTRSPGLDRNPAWSPDGSRIAFDSERDGDFAEIYVMKPDGTGQVNLTNHASTDYNPVWSPDGSKIAFHTGRSGPVQVYLMNADGTEPINLTNWPWQAVDAAWSPDGSKIAFTSWDNDVNRDDIWVINTDGAHRVNLTNSPGLQYAPRWSPDGSSIAFPSSSGNPNPRSLDGANGIYVIKSDGTALLKLTDSWAFDPAWSPDGSKIAFSFRTAVDFEDIYVINADGTGLLNLTNVPGHTDAYPVWRPQR